MNKLIDELYEVEKNDEYATHDHIIRETLIEFIKSLKESLFLNYFCDNFSKEELKKNLEYSKHLLIEALDTNYPKYQKEVDEFYKSLLYIREALMKDAIAIFNGDPASVSVNEVISTYPGFLAIYCYRIAHIFYGYNMKHLARLISEYAHSRTGIDINAGANIGESFFIDHGTGIVIGETATIGKNCKIYQGVTLGALSLKDGRALSDKKRHPTLLDNVVIYSGASIFGGDTIIGNNVVIGANAEIKESVKDNQIIRGRK